MKRTTVDAIRDLVSAMPIVIFARAIRAAFGRARAARPAANSRATHAALLIGQCPATAPTAAFALLMRRRLRIGAKTDFAQIPAPIVTRPPAEDDPGSCSSPKAR
jgi:hypothetical protein